MIKDFDKIIKDYFEEIKKDLKREWSGEAQRDIYDEVYYNMDIERFTYEYYIIKRYFDKRDKRDFDFIINHILKMEETK